MPVQPILLLGNPLLWTPAVPADPMARDTKGFGRAIAAPQIGKLTRVVFLGVGEPRPLINPRIVWQSTEQMELWDDCFSFPDLMVKVRRAAWVKVAYLDEHGAERELDAKNQLAELLQHEIDHLDGVLATDRAIDGRAFAMRCEVLRRS